MKATINGDKRVFKLVDNLKVYALRDVGFIVTKKGGWRYRYPLYIESPYQPIAELKVDINHDLNKLTMLITDLNGLTKVNIFKNDQFKEMRVLLNYVLKNLEEKSIIEEVK